MIGARSRNCPPNSTPAAATGAHLRLAIEEVAGTAWSAPEARAARLLRPHVPPFEQNVRVNFPDGTWVWVDFLWRRLRAILEIDSDEHHGRPADADDTDERHIRLSTYRLSVVHRRPYVIAHRPTQFVAGIKAWLEGRARELGVPLT